MCIMQLKVEESYVKMQIINALLSLMEKNTFNEITITQIVQTAHVGRASFYRNYKDKEDVIQKHMSFLCHRWEIEFKETNSPNNLVGSLLRHYYLERKFYQQLYKSGLSHYILDSIRQACKIEEQSNNKYAYMYSWFAGALFCWIYEWIRRGMPETPEQMENMFRDCKEIKRLNG